MLKFVFDYNSLPLFSFILSLSKNSKILQQICERNDHLVYVVSGDGIGTHNCLIVSLLP